jgi:hypothetical protein
MKAGATKVKNVNRMKALAEETNNGNDSDASNNSDDFNRKKDKKADKSNKQSNTIMQQINNFSLTPMNDQLAEQTIEDHKYLLELVENKCAIAFFAMANRNLSLYNALLSFHTQAKLDEDMNGLDN